MKKMGIEIKWGILFTLILLLWIVLEKAAGLYTENIDKHYIVTNFFALVAVAVYVVALLDKRKNSYGGKMTWKQGFVSGTIIAIVVALLTPVSQYITSAIIAPEYFPNMIEFVVDSGKMSQEAAEKNFSLQSYIIQSSIFAIVIGIITSAVVALFVKKR